MSHGGDDNVGSKEVLSTITRRHEIGTSLARELVVHWLQEADANVSSMLVVRAYIGCLLLTTYYLQEADAGVEERAVSRVDVWDKALTGLT